MEGLDLPELFLQAEKLASLGQRREAEGVYTLYIEKLTEDISKTKDNDILTSMKDKLALAYNNRGYLRYLSVDFDKAVDDYTEGMKNNDQLPVLFYNRGLIHYRLGRFEDAIQDQRTCLKLDGDFKSASYCLEQSILDRDCKSKRESEG